MRVITLDPGRLWDGQTASALEVGKQLNAKLVLAGWAEVEPGQPEGTDGTRWSMQAKVEVKVFATDTSEEIAEAQVEAIVPPAAGSQGDAETLAQAATEIAARLMPALSCISVRALKATEVMAPSREFAYGKEGTGCRV